MAEKYYDLKETMKKLGKSKEEVFGLIKTGQLQNYGNWTSPRFKVEEVDDLAGGSTELELAPVEGPKEEIKLESSGSGSGLLDLGKLTDETSFGEDVLSEILEGEIKTPPITTDIEEKIEIEAAEEKAIPVTQVAVAPKIATVETHPISNAIVLSIGLLSLIYGIIIAVAGSRNFVPGLLIINKNIFWWIVIGAIHLTMFSFVFSSWIYPQITAYLQSQSKTRKKEKKA